jgi:hypothetical protein
MPNVIIEYREDDLSPFYDMWTVDQTSDPDNRQDLPRVALTDAEYAQVLAAVKSYEAAQNILEYAVTRAAAVTAAPDRKTVTLSNGQVFRL